MQLPTATLSQCQLTQKTSWLDWSKEFDIRTAKEFLPPVDLLPMRHAFWCEPSVAKRGALFGLHRKNHFVLYHIHGTALPQRLPFSDDEKGAGNYVPAHRTDKAENSVASVFIVSTEQWHSETLQVLQHVTFSKPDQMVGVQTGQLWGKLFDFAKSGAQGFSKSDFSDGYCLNDQRFATQVFHDRPVPQSIRANTRVDEKTLQAIFTSFRQQELLDAKVWQQLAGSCDGPERLCLKTEEANARDIWHSFLANGAYLASASENILGLGQNQAQALLKRLRPRHHYTDKTMEQIANSSEALRLMRVRLVEQEQVEEAAPSRLFVPGVPKMVDDRVDQLVR